MYFEKYRLLNRLKIIDRMEIREMQSLLRKYPYGTVKQRASILLDLSQFTYTPWQQIGAEGKTAVTPDRS